MSETNLLDFENQISPYYNEYHKKYRQHVRKFVETEMTPYMDTWEKQEKIPKEFYKKILDHGSIWVFPYGFGNENFENQPWDPFYTIIFAEEIGKTCFECAAWIGAVCLPALKNFGNHKVHRQVLNQIEKGEKLISLCLSELSGGSDVARIQTTAIREDDNYIINGSKYWITGGNRADYFVTLVRTNLNDNGMNGLSLILIPRDIDGVYTSKLKLQGSNCSDTASVTFKNVKIPCNYIIGKENEGFKIVMFNFNFERFILCCGMVGMMEGCVNDCIEWTKQRKTFNQYLIKHQIIRHKIAEMARHILSCHALLEKTAYQLKYDNLGQNDKSIAKNLALLKVHCSKSLQYITAETSQIFGGRSYVIGGRGAKIERAYRLVRPYAVGGGSEDILLDLAIRQSKL